MFDRCFTLEITDQPDVLARIVTLCGQRRCQVTGLSYRAADRHRAAELVLSVRAPSWHGDRLAAWLAGLVDVLEVRESRAAPATKSEDRSHGSPRRRGSASTRERMSQRS
jgi:acetolactate synthase small subunit